MQSGYNITDLVKEAQTRWLKPAEVLFILQNYENQQLMDKPAQKPASGSLFLFNKRVLRFFRKDGHSWRRKKDGRTVGEAHERLKVGNAEALNCYYAHGEQNPNFQRRSYWMLDPAYEHIVLVHYRDTTEGRHNTGSMSQLSPGSSSTLTHSPSSYTAQLPGPAADVNGLRESISSPGSVEASSDTVIKNGRMDCLNIVERPAKVDSSSEFKISQALRELEEQLSLNDDTITKFDPPYSDYDNSNDSEILIHVQDYSRSAGMPDDLNNIWQQQYSGYNCKHHHQPLEDGVNIDSEQSLPWNEVLNYANSPGVASQEKQLYILDGNGITLLPSMSEPIQEQENHQQPNFDKHNGSSMLPPQEVEDFKFPTYSSAVNTYGTNPDYYTSFFDDAEIGMPLEADSSLTIAQKQKFMIREISPEWGYSSEATKIIVIGSFLCDPSDSAWTCMFGDIEVPLQIIQEGVICCQTPPHLPGKVTFCITSGNRESCSEVREFEYCAKPSSCARCNYPEADESKNLEEQLLLVRFAQMLLSDTSTQNGENIDLLGKFKASEDSWGQVIEALLAGTWTSLNTTDWLLQELLKDKLQQWLSSRSRGEIFHPDCSLSKKEQGIIHMVAGLGFEWALNQILSYGVGINFRDINGWTALHWAARFGREKMVAALIASGASAWAVTDPNSQDPTGKTPASIAATWGHKGLAGYLSEVALTSHLSSLKLEESELSKSSADIEAEKTVNSISNTSSLVTNEDQVSLKDTLAAVRNAAQAASRIQSAFRAHSFRRRQQREASAAADGDEYSILSNDVQGLSAASKLAFRNARDHKKLAFRNARDYNSAALSIQKKYRGWKGRKDFLAFRQKVVKIQAHVRGHQVRKNYKVICWAVGVLEKVVLRWRRRGVGLRGFRPESETIDDESEDDEDIAKVFRNQKVNVAIDEAVSRVLSMVESQEARQQYHRMLQRFRQAKAELESLNREAIPNSEGEDMYLLV
ncbi:hypothetical protein LguiB_024608 [Lonicera macranthoides]